MTTPANGDLQEHQREIQRLLGRCLLNLQQYELLIKAIVAHHDLTGPIHKLASIREVHIANAAKKTLGTLVGEFLGSSVTTDDVANTYADPLEKLPEDVISFSLRMRLSLPAEDHARIQEGLKELVALRNNLVHHFIDQHDLWTADGCRGAHDALVGANSLVDQHLEQLRGWAEQMAQTRHLAAELMQSDTLRRLMIHGVALDGSVIGKK